MTREEKREYALVEKLYQRLRKQAEHENNLYNQRIIWLITLQALLYATIGLIIQGVVATDHITRLAPIRSFFLLVCVLGILVSLISSKLLTNARHSLGEIGDIWSIQSAEIASDSSILSHFPHVLGGRNVQRAGTLLRSGNLPWLFVLSWIGTAVVLYPLTNSAQ